jgi:hypothetical protein
LAYVVDKTRGTQWNPVAYHLNNACEATANSVDAWAVGVSVAVEALVSLIRIEDEESKDKRLEALQEKMRKWLEEQSEFFDLVERVGGQIAAMSNRRPKDTLYALARRGHVEKAYINAWAGLRNRPVHPTIKDLEKPSPVDYQKLLDDIHRAEVLLRQLTFFLIGYEGSFTDYGAPGAQAFTLKQYPLKST